MLNSSNEELRAERALDVLINIDESQTGFLYYYDLKEKKSQRKKIKFEEKLGVLLIDSLRRSSKFQNQTLLVKSAIEYRLLMSLLGISNFETSKCLEDVMDRFEMTFEELRDLLKENFEDMNYTVSDIEETMNLRLSQIVADYPESVEALQSIFSLNPFK